MQLRIAICDDEEIYRATLYDYIERWEKETGRKNSVIKQTYKSGEDLLFDLEGGAIFNLLFLDIEIPKEQNGLLTAKEIYQKDPYTTIVFVTNYSEYACSGYEVNALRYILKPITYNSIVDCLDITWHKLEMIADESVIIQDGGRVISIPIRSLVYAESFGHTMHIILSEGNEYNIRVSLSEFIKQYPSNIVVQCHRSYVVSLRYIRKITRKEITLLDNTVIPLGQKYEKQLYSAFMRYHQG